jgi:hypothetical protein
VRATSEREFFKHESSNQESPSYRLLVSMAPLSNEIRPIAGCFPPHLGPAIPEISSIWFKLYLYHSTRNGPPSLLLAKGKVKLLLLCRAVTDQYRPAQEVASVGCPRSLKSAIDFW